MNLTRNEFRDLQKFMSNIVSLRFKKPNQQQLQTAVEWLEDAKSELKAFQVLKTNGLHPQMIEHLSLCIEKLVKCVGFIFSSVDQNSVKHEIGHISPRVFIKIIENANIEEFLQKNFKEHKDLNLDHYSRLRIILTSRRNVENFEKESLKLSKENINLLFSVIDDVISEIAAQLKEKTLEELYNDSPSAKTILSPIMPFIKKTKEWKTMKAAKISFLDEAMALYITLWSLSVILFPFYNISRYRSSGVEFKEGLGVLDTIELLEKKSTYCIDAVTGQIRRLTKQINLSENI